MKFLSAYSEPSCTPARVAQLTGRLPVRTGVLEVFWPGDKGGMSGKEVTVAEILKTVKYHTAFWGKWHVGEHKGQLPEDQGFDYAYYNTFNGAPWAWPDMQKMYEEEAVTGKGWFFDFPGEEEYKKKWGIRLDGIYKVKNGNKKEVGRVSSTKMPEFEAESFKQIKDWITEKSKSKRPFFINWHSFAQQMAGSPKEYRFKKGVDSRNNQAAQLAMHDEQINELREHLRKLGIEENTLLVWWSDNGPMYAFWPNAGYSLLRGGKGDVYEGGIRVPAIAEWPGMIKPGQDPMDMIHVTDLFTTAARVAGVTRKIPNDRITDGVDQMPYFLFGEGHSRRNVMFHYSGGKLGAVRMDEYKQVIVPGHGGLPGMEVYNIKRDIGEKFGAMYNYLWTVVPFKKVIGGHMKRNKKFPHRKP
jgi:arylsulfatase